MIPDFETIDETTKLCTNENYLKVKNKHVLKVLNCFFTYQYRAKLIKVPFRHKSMKFIYACNHGLLLAPLESILWKSKGIFVGTNSNNKNLQSWS